MSFKNKVVIVTGASSGIGAAAAIAFSAEGARVAIVGRNESKLAATAALCTNALVIRADVTDDGDARQIIERTVQTFGQIDVLVNNAGASKHATVYDENIMDSFDFVIKVNLRAVFRLTTLAIPHLIKTKGNIVNISSIGAYTTQLFPGVITYSVSKAALNHFGACLSADLAVHGVRVNTISPGYVKTNLIENGGYDGSWDDFNGLTALGKVAEPQEIADLVLFLASDKARSVTGSVYVCDNGSLIKRY